MPDELATYYQNVEDFYGIADAMAFHDSGIVLQPFISLSFLDSRLVRFSVDYQLNSAKETFTGELIDSLIDDTGLAEQMRSSIDTTWVDEPTDRITYTSRVDTSGKPIVVSYSLEYTWFRKRREQLGG
jgi:hypothetical protein